MAEPNEARKKLAFEEFKLFYESAEKVTDRRLETNRWNYSIGVAILLAVAGIINWGISKPPFLFVSLIAVAVLCIMAVLFCSLWIGQIRDFKSLNNAKFAVLNQMAPSVSFSAPDSDARVSYAPFEREWEALKKAEAVQEIASFNIVALKSSNMEYLIPRAFRVLFLVLLLTVILVVVRNWQALLQSSVLVLPPVTSSQTQPPK